MTRVQFLAHIKDKNLKFKLYRKDELTLPKLLGVVSQYHDKEALVLVPEEQVNRAEATNKPINPPMKFQGRCYKCSRAATWQKTVAVHVTTFVKPAADSAILQFVVDTD